MFKEFLKNKIISDVFLHTYRILHPSQRLHALKIFVLMFIGNLLDIFSLASILPLIYFTLNPGSISDIPVVQKIYNSVGLSDFNSFLLLIVFLLLLLFVIKNIVSLWIIHQQAKFVHSVASNLSLRQFRNFLSKDFLYYKNTNSGLIHRDIDILPTTYVNNIILPTLLLISELVIILFITISLSIYHFQLFSIIVFTMVPAFYIIFYFLKRKVKKLALNLLELNPVNSRNVYNLIFGYIDAKISGKENFFLNKYQSSRTKLNQLQSREYTYDFAPVKLIEIAAIFGIVIIYSYVIMFGAQKVELITLLSLYAAASYRLMPSVNRMINALVKIKAWEGGFDFLKDIYAWKDKKTDIDKVHENGVIQFEKVLRFNNICFRYDETRDLILRNINFSILKGEIIGFIGKSGSGKTTLMNILLRFLKESDGEIFIDDKKLFDYQKNQWRKLIGYVQQDVYILDSSLAENIAYGELSNEIDRKKLQDVIELSSLNEFVLQLKDGIETNMGEFGNKISGGQKQRIGIARALYKNAKLLVFDEVTSQLDNSTEREITDSINKLSGKNITILIIAHRLSTLRYCNRIFTLSNGEIISEQKYSEILTQ